MPEHAFDGRIQGHLRWHLNETAVVVCVSEGIADKTADSYVNMQMHPVDSWT